MLIKSVHWNSLAIAGARSWIAAATVLLLVPRVRWSFTPVKWATAICYTGTVALFVSANKLTTAANAIFLQYTAPIYIAILGAWLLKERPARLDWLLILITQGGIALFFLDELRPGHLLGNVFALASGLSFAALTLLLRLQKDGSPFESVLLGNILTGLLGLPFMFDACPSWGSVGGLVLLGVVQLGLPYVLFASAIRQVRALEASLISTLEPVLNPLWAFLFLQESPGRWALWGGTIVIGCALTRGILTARRLDQNSGQPVA